MKILKFFLVLFLLSGVVVSAQGNDSIIDPTKLGEIEIIKYALQDGKYVDSTHTTQDMSTISNMPLENVEFKYLKIGNMETILSGDNAGLYYELTPLFHQFLSDNHITVNFDNINGKEYIDTDNINLLSKSINESLGNASQLSDSDALNTFILTNGSSFPLTDKQGKTSLNNLELGLYVIAENKNDNFYDNKQILKQVQPFFVGLPSTNIIPNEQTGSYWNYKITVYPKNEMIGFSKYVIEDNKLQTSVDFNLGDTISFLLDAQVPFLQKSNKVNSYSKLEIKDTYTEGISVDDLENTLSVTLGNGYDNPENKLLVLNEDYTLTKDVNSFTITLNGNGIRFINEITADTHLYVKYQGTLNQLAAKNTGNIKQEINKANITIDTETTEESTFESNNSVYLYNYEININKLFSKEVVDKSCVSFSIFNNQNKLSFIKEKEGVYHLDQTSTNKTTVLNADRNGLLIVKGLDQGEYEIKEISTALGFNLLKEPIKLTITKTTNVDGTIENALLSINDEIPVSLTKGLDKGVVSFSLTNNRVVETIHTGGDGWSVGSFVLAMILVSGGILLVINKKKNEV